MPTKKLNNLKTMKDVESFIKQIKPYFFMEQYILDVSKSKENKKNNDGTLADISTRHDYLDADLTIYPIFFKEPSRSQKIILIHELCHIITSVQANRMWELMQGRHMTRTEYNEIWEKENNWWERIMTKLLEDKVNLK